MNAGAVSVGAVHFECRIRGSAAVLSFGSDVVARATDVEAREALLTALENIDRAGDIRALLALYEEDSLSSSRYADFQHRIRAGKSGAEIIRRDVLLSREEIAIDDYVKRIHRSSKITAVGLRGEVATPFVGEALAFDFRFCTPETTLSFDFRAFEEPPGGGVGFFLPRYVGQAHAVELLLRCQVLSAEEALALGLVTRILEPEGFDEACLLELRCLVNMPRSISAATKVLLYPDRGTALDQYLESEYAQMRIART